MKATRSPSKPSYRPVDLTLETEEEYRDLRWLVSHDITIPEALAGHSYSDSPEARRTRAGRIIAKLIEALDSVGPVE